jgi:hypothetical protein
MRKNPFKLNQNVRFAPKSDTWEEDYTSAGVRPGDIGVVVGVDFDDDVVVNFLRQDGSICEHFFAFIEDVEAVDE